MWITAPQESRNPREPARTATPPRCVPTDGLRPARAHVAGAGGRGVAGRSGAGSAMSDGFIAVQQDGDGANARGDVAAAGQSTHARRCDVTHVAVAIEELHELVARRRVRVEITRAGCDDCCVLISRQELEAL